LSELKDSSFEPQQSSDRVVVVGERSEFEVTCVPPDGRPPPRVWWRGPQGRVVSDSGPTHVDETRLIIESARLEDAGNYSCEAENIAGSTTASIRLIVTSKLYFFLNAFVFLIKLYSHLVYLVSM
jgi:PTK7 protein tyrosine kinase 7